MEISTILTADVLDIIFEGKNKSYGAYELRKSYQRRLTIAITVMLSITLLALAAYLIAGRQKEVQARQIELPPDTILKSVEEKKEEVIPPPPKQEPPPQVQTIRVTMPIIVKDEDVKEEEKPPEMDKLEDVRIGSVNQEGVKDDNMVAPPIDDAGRGIVEAPKPRENPDSLFLKVEIESYYPGGPSQWQRFIHKTLNYPQDAQDNEIQGTVVVQFIVDNDGVVSSVEAISGPNELREEATRVIRKSGKWEPAVQNHRKVKSYKKQPITFKLLTE